MTDGDFPRFGEAPSRVRDVTRVAQRLSGAILAGVCAAGLITLIVGIVMQEALLDLEIRWRLDPMLRATMGSLLACASATGAVFGVLSAFQPLVVRRAWEHAFRANLGIVPPHPIRRALARPEGERLMALGIWILILSLLGASLGVFIVVDTRRPAAEVVAVVIAAVLCCALAVLCMVAGRSVDKGWAERLRPLQEAWATDAAAIDESDATLRASAPDATLPGVVVPGAASPGARARTTLARGSGILFGAALLAFLFSVWMRKPCRRCDERYWADPIEQLIDVVSLVSGVTLLLIAAGALVALVVHVATLIVRERELLEWAGAGGVRRVPHEQLVAVQFGPSPAPHLAWGCGGVAGFVATLTFGMLWSGWWGLDPAPGFWAAAVFAVLALALFAADEVLTPYRRTVLRAATAPGDLRPDIGAPHRRGRGDRRRGERRRTRRRPPVR